MGPPGPLELAALIWTPGSARASLDMLRTSVLEYVSKSYGESELTSMLSSSGEPSRAFRLNWLLDWFEL